MGRGIFVVRNPKHYLCLDVSGDGRLFLSTTIPLNVILFHNPENNVTCLQKNKERTNFAEILLSKKQQQFYYKINKSYQSAVKGSVLLVILFQLQPVQNARRSTSCAAVCF
jgi:hypothetical protein